MKLMKNDEKRSCLPNAEEDGVGGHGHREKKTYFHECCYTNRSVKLVINKGEIINYNEIYIQHVTKERN